MYRSIEIAQACYAAGFRDAALIQIVTLGIAGNENDPDNPCGAFDIDGIPEAEARDITAAAIWAYRIFRDSSNSFEGWDFSEACRSNGRHAYEAQEVCATVGDPNALRMVRDVDGNIVVLTPAGEAVERQYPER